jgi:hypothetical protein
VLKRVVTSRISKSCRVVPDIAVEIYARLETNRVFADEPPNGFVVIAHPVLVDSGLKIKLSSGVLEGIDERTRRCGQLAE